MRTIRTEILEKIVAQRRPEDKGLDLLSEHVKGWVDFEVKAVESSTAQANVELLNEIRAIKKLLAIHLNWSLETLLIT